MVRPSLLVACLFVSATAAAAQTREWGWFRSVSTGSAWDATGGKGTVTLGEGKFEAELFDKEHPMFRRLTVRGLTKGGLTSARVRVEESDVPDFEVTGRLRRLCWRGGGREVLLLTDGTQVIGLVRELNASQRCTPA